MNKSKCVMRSTFNDQYIFKFCGFSVMEFYLSAHHHLSVLRVLLSTSHSPAQGMKIKFNSCKKKDIIIKANSLKKCIPKTHVNCPRQAFRLSILYFSSLQLHWLSCQLIIWMSLYIANKNIINYRNEQLFKYSNIIWNSHWLV